MARTIKSSRICNSGVIALLLSKDDTNCCIKCSEPGKLWGLFNEFIEEAFEDKQVWLLERAADCEDIGTF